MNKHKGIVLLVVLIFLQIFTLTSLLSYMSIQMLFKIHHTAWSRTEDVILAKQQLHEIEANIINESNCFIPLISASAIRKMPIEWWQEHACTVSDEMNNYFYVIESLGRDDCSVIQVLDTAHLRGTTTKQDGKTIVATFYRVSLLLTHKLERQLLIQSTVAVPVVAETTCQMNPHLVMLGQQMLREI